MDIYPSNAGKSLNRIFDGKITDGDGLVVGSDEDGDIFVTGASKSCHL